MSPFVDVSLDLSGVTLALNLLPIVIEVSKWVWKKFAGVNMNNVIKKIVYLVGSLVGSKMPALR